MDARALDDDLDDQNSRNDTEFLKELMISVDHSGVVLISSREYLGHIDHGLKE